MGFVFIGTNISKCVKVQDIWGENVLLWRTDCVCSVSAFCISPPLPAHPTITASPLGERGPMLGIYLCTQPTPTSAV